MIIYDTKHSSFSVQTERTDPDKSGLVADLSIATSATIDSLRQSLRLQSYLKDYRNFYNN